MSFTLPAVDLSAATVGTSSSVSWAGVAPQAAYAASGATPHLAIFNESGCGLTLNFQMGEQIFIPAGGWRNVALNAACTSFDYSVVYVMSGPLVTSLIVVWFGPDEEPPPPTILGNSPIGGNITTGTSTTAQLLTGASQTLAVTEVDDGGSPALAPGAGTSLALLLGGRNELGSYNRVARIGASTSPPTSFMTITGLLTTDTFDVTQTIIVYNNLTTVANGVPSLHYQQFGTSVTSTGAQTYTYTTATQTGGGLYRISGYIIINNGVSGNNITFTAGYTDANGFARTDTLPLAFSTGTLFPGGGTSIANGHFSTSWTIAVTSAGVITITYRDPTNTPADKLYFVIERLV